MKMVYAAKTRATESAINVGAYDGTDLLDASVGYTDRASFDRAEGGLMALSELIHERGRLLSILDLAELMKDIDIVAALECIAAIGYLEGACTTDHTRAQSEVINKRLADLLKLCEKCEYTATVGKIREFALYQIDNGKHIDKARMLKMYVSISESFRIESVRSNFLLMERPAFWKKPLDGWEDVVSKIVNADLEDQISEASRCYALGRNAACVFHLNCVVDIGLRHIKTRIPRINIDPNSKKAMWSAWVGAIASYCNQSPRPNEADKLEAINAVLAAIKTPWRDLPTHAVYMVRIDEEARIQYDGIKRVMNLIAAL